ncbi:uncharacterized protein LOC134697596 [Mytilus trossulus]|uniref:uncharacterized protein LOC134697596 n=1 Tax=Mytilus trossulus TaxID=6551 RepID=UPI003007497F
MKHKKDREESYSTLDSKKHKKKRAKHRRNSNVYSRYSEKSFDFEINKFEVLQPEDFKQPDERQLASETIYSDTTCTYDDEEQRRRRWRRKKKKNKRLQDQQMRDNEYILEDKNDNVRYYVPRLGQDMRT